MICIFQTFRTWHLTPKAQQKIPKLELPSLIASFISKDSPNITIRSGANEAKCLHSQKEGLRSKFLRIIGNILNLTAVRTAPAAQKSVSYETKTLPISFIIHCQGPLESQTH